MIITKLKERPQVTIDDDGNKVVSEKPPINRATVVAVQAQAVFTQVLINVKKYLVKDVNRGFTKDKALPYLLINYNDGRTEQFMFNHNCGQIHLSNAFDEKERQICVWLFNWPNDLVEIKEFTVQDEVEAEEATEEDLKNFKEVG